jgi:hypothetical protein
LLPIAASKVKRCLEGIIEKLDALDRRLSGQSGVDIDGDHANTVASSVSGPNTGGSVNGASGDDALIPPKVRHQSEDIEMRTSSVSDASQSSSSAAAAAAVSATAFVGASIVADGPALQFALAKVCFLVFSFYFQSHRSK